MELTMTVFTGVGSSVGAASPIRRVKHGRVAEARRSTEFSTPSATETSHPPHIKTSHLSENPDVPTAPSQGTTSRILRGFLLLQVWTVQGLSKPISYTPMPPMQLFFFAGAPLL